MCPMPCDARARRTAPVPRTRPASARHCPIRAPRRPTRCRVARASRRASSRPSNASTRSATGRSVSVHGMMPREATPEVGTRADGDRSGVRGRGGRRAAVRLVRRAHGPGGLRRHLRARPPDRRRATGSAATCSSWCASSASRSSAIRAATSSPATTGRTASGRASSARAGSTSPGARSRPISSAPTSSSPGRGSAGVEPMLAVNLGTRGIDAARDLVEYCNAPGAAPRGRIGARANGHAEPYGDHVWCLGNEMDGPVADRPQDAVEYGRLAAETGKAMRLVDPSIELVVVRQLELRDADVRRLGGHGARPRLGRRRLRLAAHLLRPAEVRRASTRSSALLARPRPA